MLGEPIGHLLAVEHLLIHIAFTLFLEVGGLLPVMWNKVRKRNSKISKATPLISEKLLTCFDISFYNDRSKFAISIADNAASAPLLPAFVPARSIACSMDSVVKTPKITGFSDCKDA